jgi:hypothetical protein
VSGLTTSWTKKAHDIVDSLIGAEGSRHRGLIYESPINIEENFDSSDL